MKVCDECVNYECDNFDGVGWCNLNKAMVLHDDPACKEFRELPEKFRTPEFVFKAAQTK